MTPIQTSGGTIQSLAEFHDERFSDTYSEVAVDLAGEKCDRRDPCGNRSNALSDGMARGRTRTFRRTLRAGEGRSVFRGSGDECGASEAHSCRDQNRLRVGDAEGWRDTFNTATSGWESLSAEKSILVDDELLSVHLLNLQSWLPEFSFGAIGETMRTIREVKTEAEIASMQRAADLIDAIYANSLSFLKAGITEIDLADHILAQIKAAGSTPSFSPLICFGANAASPHHHTGNTQLRQGDVVIIDIGCTSNGYASDITRTVSFGEPADSEAKAVYEVVYKAHHAARDNAKPGTSGESVDSAARNVIAEAGYGAFFIHRLGHGIGLSCHEPPSIVGGNVDPIRVGMCFSVEPGVYLQGRFGVRLENIVTVTEEGVRSLNAEVSPTLPVIGSF